MVDAKVGNLTLPFLADYAKSGRAACRGCKDPIPKDSLRLAVMVQSPFFDGKQPNWHHFHCFFGRCRPKDITEISHFDQLRWDDQEKIRKKLETSIEAATITSKKKKGKKRIKVVNVPDLNDYKVDYAKSGKSKCKFCEEYISKNEVRISKKDYESEMALRYGPHERWHHVDCFLKVREELGFFTSGEYLPGFKTLSPDDQKIIKKKIIEKKVPDDADGPSPTKRQKESISDDLKSGLKKQNDAMFKNRDQLETLQKFELIHLMEYNNQDVPEGMAKILDRLADVMTFGAMKRCEKCNGQFAFQTGRGYRCTGHVSEWARCENRTSNPLRVVFKVPEDLKNSYEFLNKYEGTVEERLFIESKPQAEAKAKATVKSSSNKILPLESLHFLIHKLNSNDKSVNDLKTQIKTLGGKTVSKFNENITAVISTKDELEKKNLTKVLSLAKDSDIPVLSAAFFDAISNSTLENELNQLFGDNKISPWGADDKKISLPKNEGKLKKSLYPQKSGMFKSGESVKKIMLKDGLAVDPESDLEKVAHVYRNGKDIYSTVLSLTDIQANRNSYYKMQILEDDKKNKYWLFRSWGRIGTTIGGSKVDEFNQSLEECITMFKELFEEKTGNVWELRHTFVKVPGKLMMLEVSYKESENEVVLKPEMDVSTSNLHKAVRDLITLIFDIEAMKKTMLEFELDLVKMPLGKISQSQIQEAFSILSELQNLIKSSDKTMITERTNRFYTLVPHHFGTEAPSLLNEEELIKQKIDILNSLMEIDIAYKILQECQKSGNTIDDHYMKLNAEIVVLERESEEFKLIEAYVKNTHAKTHMNYSLIIEEVFKIERKGEAKRYKKFGKLANRKLLWHGSRVTNFAGIISQGLRIAPPEAPVTGYMFGKGIYFADMVSKSANYCLTTKKNPTGLLLLCEVALGEMYELTKAKCIEKLPKGKHSVKGMGKTTPDPLQMALTPTGAEIPLGPGIDSGVKNSSLLYNEYIVYDVSQVKIEYLLRLKFDHKV